LILAPAFGFPCEREARYSGSVMLGGIAVSTYWRGALTRKWLVVLAGLMGSPPL
jgi:hypothetical protein